jgi:Bifunctional DNA primase/polymerase, N-terminal/Primase C terminal 1 (PriCT-1)
MSTARDMPAAALWYAAHGIPVFPCKPRGKEPLTPHGFKDATIDHAIISEWWTRWPDANIGMPTGALSKRLVIDVDPRNGGEESLAELLATYGPFPRTAEQATGGGGRHIVFQHPGGPIPKTLAPGIDFKGDGGYIIVSPSIHPNGNEYAWIGENVEDILSPVDAPAWLIEALQVARRNEAVRVTAAVDAEKWAPGERNNRLASLAGTMRRREMSRDSIEAALLEENQRRCAPPLPEAEVRRIAASVASYKPAEAGYRGAGEDDHGSMHSPFGNWPDALKPEAYHGVAGELVRLIEPHSEADPAALLIQLLVGFGNLIGRGPHFVAEADKHSTNLFAVLVGQTAKGRKGTSLGQVKRILAELDSEWISKRVKSGLASGEGLIWAVRDEIHERSPVREKGRIVRYEDIVSDEGEQDKRLWVVEPEFARVLQVAERESNTLSAVIREAWDTGNLRILTKRQAACSTEAHISIVGHITKDELRRLLTDTAAGNGFANRFLWVCTKRSQVLPEGGALHTVDFQPIIGRLRAAVDFARRTAEMKRDDQARDIWKAVYEDLSAGKPGMLGAVTSRADPQVMRLACIYALLDCSAVIQTQHLLAALAVWQYCEDSAGFIFGAALGDETADEILRALRQRGSGMTRTDIRDHFGRNKSAADIGRALAVLQEYGLARMEQEHGDQGRPAERWFPISATTTTKTT